MELGYQPDETFCLKISQLRELFVVRWSVFLLGPSGCGKTAIWRTLMKAQNNAGEKTVSMPRTLANPLRLSCVHDRQHVIPAVVLYPIANMHFQQSSQKPCHRLCMPASNVPMDRCSP